MNEQWKELKETIVEIRDNNKFENEDVTFTCRFLVNYMEILEKQMQEPCEDVAKERYEDLCEYFDKAKDILKNREDFKAWLGRVRWHIRKAEELSAENDD